MSEPGEVRRLVRDYATECVANANRANVYVQGAWDRLSAEIERLDHIAAVYAALVAAANHALARLDQRVDPAIADVGMDRSWVRDSIAPLRAAYDAIDHPADRHAAIGTEEQGGSER